MSLSHSDLAFILQDDPATSDSSSQPNAMGPDILQQALAETHVSLSDNVSKQTSKIVVAMDDLLPPVPKSAFSTPLDNILYFDTPTNPNEPSSTTEPKSSVSTTSNDRLLDQLASVVSVDTNTTATVDIKDNSCVQHPNQLYSNSQREVFTLYQSPDGTITMRRPEGQVIPKQVNSTTQNALSDSLRVPSSNNLILIPNTASDGSVTYSVTVPKVVSRPPIIGRRTLPASSSSIPSVTTITRTIMSPGVKKSTILNPSAPYMAKSQPLLLPKPLAPIRPMIPVVPQNTQRTPIKLIQRGSSFQTLHPLSQSQLSDVVQALKRSNIQSSPHGSYKSEPQVIVAGEEKSKVVYTVLYPENIEPDTTSNDALDDHANQSNLKLKDTAKRIDSSDEDSCGEGTTSPVTKVQQYYPHELLTTSFVKKAMKTRRRGRPTKREALEMHDEPSSSKAKKLCREFGLSRASANAIFNDIVPDKLSKDEIPSNSKFGDEIEDEFDDENDHLRKGELTTRSGRKSRPPPPKDEEIKQKTTENKVTESNFQKAPKKQFTIPSRYRCRVCQKVYLGDKKMNRHVRLNPTHGPTLEENPRPKVKSSLPAQNTSVSATIAPSITSTPACSAQLLNNRKMPEFSIPIIPMARTQLEELVKNLDSELVLDVVAKKMFDNFSMWTLLSRKMATMKEKGSKRLKKFFDDIEEIISETKRMVDCSMSTTKLSSDAPSVSFGEQVQLALNLQEGPWYLEQAKHVPEEYHKMFGIQPPIMSPRSDSTATNLMLPDVDDAAGDEENSNSVASSTISTQDRSHGATNNSHRNPTMVLEKNLGATTMDEDIDEDTQDNCTLLKASKTSKSNKEKDESDFDDSKNGSHYSTRMSPVEFPHCENSNITPAQRLHQNGNDDNEVDPKRVLEQNGIDIASSGADVNSEEAIKMDTSTNEHCGDDLVREIDSLGPFPVPGTDQYTSVAQSNNKTRLPSFSSIMSGAHTSEPICITPTSVPASTILTSRNSDMQHQIEHSHNEQEDDDIVSAISSVLSSPQNQSHENHGSSIHLDKNSTETMNVLENINKSSAVVDFPTSLQEELKRSMASLVSADCGNILQSTMITSGNNHLHQSGPASVDPDRLQRSNPPSVSQMGHHMSGPASVDPILLRHVSAPESAEHLGSHISGPPSVDRRSHPSGPPSVDPHQHHHISGPPSVASVDQHNQHPISGPSSVDQSHHHLISGPPSVDQHHQASGPPSVDRRSYISGPPSVDRQSSTKPVLHHGSVPNSPCIDQLSHIGKQVHSVPTPSGPPSVDTSKILHTSGNEHHSIPNSPAFSEKNQPVDELKRRKPEATDDGEQELSVASSLPGSSVSASTLFSSENEHHIISTVGFSSNLSTNVTLTTENSKMLLGHNESSNSNLFNDIDSVLNETSGFPFTSALHSDSMQASALKTPEKLMHSIPPSSMMKAKPTREDDECLKIESSKSRTDFLGAIGSNNGSSSVLSKSNPKEDKAFERAASGEAMDDDEEGLHDEEHDKANDALSDLFDEMKNSREQHKD